VGLRASWDGLVILFLSGWCSDPPRPDRQSSALAYDASAADHRGRLKPTLANRNDLAYGAITKTLGGGAFARRGATASFDMNSVDMAAVGSVPWSAQSASRP